MLEPDLIGAAQPRRATGARRPPSPVYEALRHNFGHVLRVAGMSVSIGGGYYIIFVYSISYLNDRMHVSVAHAMDINTACLFVLAVLPLLTGRLSDRIGRRPFLVGGMLGFVLLSYPLWWLMHQQDLWLIFAGQMGFVMIFGVIYGAMPAALPEILPRHIRVSALSIGYSGALALFGGTAPAVATYLLERTGDDFAPAYYLTALGIVSFLAVLTIPETRGRSLAT